jgi:hypothetical protein
MALPTIGLHQGADHQLLISVPLVERLMHIPREWHDGLYGCFSMINIYVGNLSYQVNNDELRQAFEQFGEVSFANVVIDKATGRSKGFGFVEMPDRAAGEEAIKQLNEQPLKGRNVRVNEARPRENQSPFPPRSARRD